MATPKPAPRRLVAILLALLALAGAFTVVLPGHAVSAPVASAPALPGASLSHGVRHASLETPLARTLAAASGAGTPKLAGPVHYGLGNFPAAGAFYPNPNRLAPNAPLVAIIPGYTTVPAPMGVADLGVGASGTYTYRTTGFEGTFTARSFDALTPGIAQAAPFDAPDWALLQLNAVAVNVTYSSVAPAGVFWIQNTVHLNRTGFQFEDNVWNFTGLNAPITPSILFGKGHVVRNQFYASFGSFTPASYPLTLRVSDNITRVLTHVVVHFNYTLVPSVGSPVTVNYDNVTFNGTASGLSPPQFEVNGTLTTPSGLFYDAEFVLGGNGGGSHANIVSLNATATLQSWSSTSHTYTPVASAYDFGVDSSETAFGVSEHYAVGGTTAFLESGPSVLCGLWKTTNGSIAPAPGPGSIHVQITTHPSYAFLFVNLTTVGGGYSYAPSGANGVMTTDLPPLLNGNPYHFQAWADGFASASVNVTNSSTGTVTLNLTASATTEDAPIYLNGDTQVPEFAAAGVPGTAYALGSSTLWINASQVHLALPFRTVNMMAYPAFQLFTERGLSTNVVLNALVQDPATFNYSNYSSATLRFLPGWTQGYFFFGGTGHFSVDVVSVRALPALLNSAHPTFPVPTVEVYETSHALVRNVTASSDAIGVTADRSSALVIDSIFASSGAQGVVARQLSGITVHKVNASGLDSFLTGSTGVLLSHVTSGAVSDLAASDFALGLNLSNSSNLRVVGLTVTTSAKGIEASTSGPANVSWMNVTGGVLSAAGNWTHSSLLRFSNLSIVGTGLDLENDSVVWVNSSAAVGAGTSVVDDFSGSASGSFASIYASGGAFGLNVSDASNLKIVNLTAQLGSIGALVNNSLNVVGDGIISIDNSTGVFLSGGTNAAFGNVSVFTLSLGVWAQFSSRLSVSNVTAFNASLGTEFYRLDPTTFLYYPVAPVALFNETSANVSSVQVTSYPFAVWSNGTHYLNVTNVIGWYGGVVVDLNATRAPHVGYVFSFGSQNGLWLENCTRARVSNSTFEASVGIGLLVDNGSANEIFDNNFVGNNGASATGGFSPSHLQAWANNSTLATVTFSKNFWSDRSGTSAYVVNNSIRDTGTQVVFYSTYLEFAESGLIPGLIPWAVSLGSYPTYNTTLPLFYIPGWSLPATPTRIPFAVLYPLFIPPNPRYGNVTWSGATLPTIVITFGTPVEPLTILGLAVWEFITVVVVALVVVLGVMIWWLRRRRPPVRRAPQPYEPDLPS